MNITVGQLLEYRVARIAFTQGYFTRRRIAVRSLFYPERMDVTDIDVLGIRFDTNFRRYTAVWECRSGQQKTVDSILWLLGMSQYINADYKVIVKPTIPDKIKALGEAIGVSTWDEHLLSSQERIHANYKLKGSHDPEKYHSASVERYNIIRGLPKLSRIYWFQNSHFWFQTPAIRLKKILNSLSDCKYEIIGLDVRETGAAQDLLLEGIILTAVALLDFAGQLYVWQKDNLRDPVANHLVSGLGTPDERKQIIHAAVEYASALYGKKPLDTRESPLNIPAPEYTEYLTENLERIYEHPAAAIQVPRFLELIIYDYIVPKISIEANELKTIFSEDIGLLTKMGKNVVTFLEKAIGFPKEIMQPLLNM